MIEFWINAPHHVACLMPESDADYAGWLQWMGDNAREVLGLDSETNARDPWERGYRCRLIQISDADIAWVIDPQSAYRDLIRDTIREHPRFVGHFTATAEVPFIERELPGAIRLGEEEPHIIDLQVAQAIVDPRTLLSRKDIDPRLVHKKGLKDSYARDVSPCLGEAEKRLHVWFHDNAPKGHKTPNKAKAWGFANVPLWTPEYLEYSAMDAVAAKVLYDKYVTRLRAMGEWEHAQYEFKLQWDIDNMVFRGSPVDPGYVRWVAAQLDGVVDEEARWLSKHDIPKSAMWQSIGKAFTALGQEPVKWNKGKDDKPDTPSWDKFALADIKDASTTPAAVELAEHITACRRAGKFKVAYIQPMLDSLDRDCRIHPQFRSIGTITHRNSASKPPVQQLPKGDKRVRAALGGHKGWVFVSCDLEQGEPRTMAGLSGDPAYVAAVMSGDVNNAVATATFGEAFVAAEGKSAGTASYRMRQMAKIDFLSVCYGVGVDKLSRSMKSTKDAAAKFRNDQHQNYRHMFRRADKMNQNEYVTLPSGRKVVLWDRKIVLPDGRVITSAKPSRKALNYETQAAQADWMKAAWLKLRTKWRWALAILMHDEIVLYVPEAFAEEACRDLEAAMSGPIGNGVMMLATAEINGITWAEQPADFDASELAIADDLPDDEEVAA
jgi:DNA polymerase-1